MDTNYIRRSDVQMATKTVSKGGITGPDKACNRPHYEARPGGLRWWVETSWDYIPRDEKFFEGVAQTIYVEQYCLFGKC